MRFLADEVSLDTYVNVSWRVCGYAESTPVPPIDPNTLPKDVDMLRKIVVDLCEQPRHESSEKDKYRSLLRELLYAQRNRKSEQLSKEQESGGEANGYESIDFRQDCST
jgi:hypothetical protein